MVPKGSGSGKYSTMRCLSADGVAVIKFVVGGFQSGSNPCPPGSSGWGSGTADLLPSWPRLSLPVGSHNHDVFAKMEDELYEAINS
jgi:tartrate dehydratase alpha subunit/fumarate hydratase class I-like protein